MALANSENRPGREYIHSLYKLRWSDIAEQLYRIIRASTAAPAMQGLTALNYFSLTQFIILV